MTVPSADTTCSGCKADFPSDALFCPMCGLPAPKARAKEIAATDTFIGRLIGDRYLLQNRIGDGGSGIIYRAEHVTLRRPVAVKLLHHKLSKDDLAIERFRREATTVAEIDNDHVVKVFDFGRAPDGRLFFVMEYLEGETLAQAIGGGKMPIPRIVDVLVQICEALMEAHAMGYVHRDLRPGNVFLTTKRGRKDYVKLLDFGLAKLLTPGGEASQTSLGMTFGDPRYMSPEQARGQTLDRRSDIYALGIIGYEMLCGKPPFGGQKTLDVLQKQLEVIPTPPSAVRKDVPTWMEAVVLRALAKRPDDRFVTVMRMIEAIKEGEKQLAAASAPNLAQTQLPPPAAPAEDPRRDALAVFGRDTIPDTHPPFEVNVVDTAQPTVAAHEPPANPFENMPVTDRDPAAPISLDHRPPSIPEPVAIASVPTVNVTSPPAEVQSASQAFFAATDPSPSQPSAPQPYSPAPSAYAGQAAPADSLWDEEPAPRGTPKALKITVAVMGVVVLGIGVFMFWPRKPPPDTTPLAAAQAPKTEPAPPAIAPTPPPVAPAPIVEPVKPEPAPAPVAKKTEPPKPIEKPAPKAAEKPAPLLPKIVEKPKAAEKPSPPPKVVAKATPPAKTEKSETPAPEKSKPPAKPPKSEQPLDPYGSAPTTTPPPSTQPTSEEAQAEGYVKMGRLFLQRQDFAKAAASFNRAREHDPRNADAIAGLGQIAYQQSKYDDAAVHFRAAVRLSPGRASFHVWLGHSLLGGGHAREAEAEYKAALQLDPNNGPAKQGLDAAQKR